MRMTPRTIEARGLTLRVERDRDVWWLRGDGCIDAQTVESVSRVVDELLFESPAPRIVFDLRGVAQVSSAGAGLFLAAQARARGCEGAVALVGPSDRVRGVLEVLGVLDEVPSYPTPEAAARALSGPYTRSAQPEGWAEVRARGRVG